MSIAIQEFNVAIRHRGDMRYLQELRYKLNRAIGRVIAEGNPTD